MLKTMILICAMQVDPGHCQENTALDVLLGPDAANAAVCAFQGQAFLAQTALAPRGPSEYAKIVCRRSAMEATARDR